VNVAETLGSLSGSGAVNANAAITVANTSLAVSSFTGTFTGSSALNKSGTGTLSFGGNNSSSYSGAVNVSGGVVKAAATGALGSGTVTLSAGSVLGGNGATTTNSIVIGTAATSDTTSYATAANLLTWDLGTVANPNPTPLAASTVAAGSITTTGLTRSVFTAGTSTTGWGGNAFNYADAAAAITASAFVTVNITTTSLLKIKSILASTYYRSGTGPRNTLWQYKIGSENYVDITTVALGASANATTISQDSIDLSGITALQSIAANSTVTFRLVSYGATASGGTWYLRDTALTTTDFGFFGQIGSGTIGVDATGTGTLGMADVGTTTFSTGTITVNNTATLDATLSNSTAIFQGVITGAGSITKTGAGIVKLSGANDFSGGLTISAGTLQVGEASTSGTLGLGTVTNNAALIFNRSDALSVANVISGTGSLTQAGAGNLTLSAGNSYSGATTVSAGTLTAGNNSAFGTSAVTIDGGTLALGGFSIANNVTVTSGTLSGGTIPVAQVTPQAGTISAILSGSGSLSKSVAGTLTLSGANTFTGATSVTAGTLATSGDARLASTSGVTVGASGTLSLGGNETLNTLSNSGTVTIASGKTLTTGSSSYTLGGTVTGDGRLTKAGAGILTLSSSGTFSYAGLTTVSNGTLAFGASDQLGGSNAITVSGGTLNLASFSDTVGVVTLTSGSITGTTGVLTATSITSDTATTATLSAKLGGATTLTMSGTGILTVSGANDFTGATNVSAGTLNASSGALAGTSGITVGVGAVVSAADFKAGATITLSDATSRAEFTAAPSSVGAVSNAGTATNALNFSGAGALTVASLTGAGKTRFGGAATITGGISEGDVTVVGLLTGNVYSGAGTISAGSMTGSVGSSVSVSGLLTGAITAGTNTAGSLTSIEVSGGTTTVSGVAEITTMTTGTVNLRGATATIGTLTNGTVNLGTSTLATALTVNDGTYAGLIAGTKGSLIKATAGTLTLSGANSFGGGTSVNAGTLILGNLGSLGSGAVTVAADATLNLAGYGVSNAITVQTGGHITGGPSAADANTSGATPVINTVLTGTGGLSKADGGTLTLSTPNFYEGATVANVAGAVIKAAFLADTSSSLGVAGLADPANLVIGAGAKLEFTGDTNTSSSRSFTIAGSGTIAATGDGALNFNSNSKIRLTGATPALTLSATSTTAVNRFDSALDGTDAISTLTIDGVGQWVIGGSANRFKGTATISIVAGASLGFESGSIGGSVNASSPITISNNAILVWSGNNNTDDVSARLRIGAGDTAKLNIGSNNVEFVSAPQNTAGNGAAVGSIQKQGTGTLTIASSVNAATLAFDVPTGKLTINGTVGDVGLSTGATLGGSGTVGTVTTQTGSTVSAGNSPGTLTIDGNFLLGAATILRWEVQDALDPQKYDQTHVTGNLNLSAVTNNSERIVIKVVSLVGAGAGAGVDLGPPLNFNNADTNGMMPRTFDFIRVDGIISFAAGKSISDVFSFDLTDFQYTNGGSKSIGLWSVSSYDSGGDTYVRITAVPEPSTYGFGLGALALAAAAIRRRKHNSKSKA